MRPARRLDGINELCRRETGRNGRSRGEAPLLLHHVTEGARIEVPVGIPTRTTRRHLEGSPTLLQR